MDRAVVPAEVIWRIIEYTEKAPLVLMLVCRDFASNIKNYTRRQFFMRGDEHDMSICASGPIRNVRLIRCDGKYLRVLNPRALTLNASVVTDAHMLPLNRLTRLDMSYHKLITDDALSRLTMLTVLDISDARQITQAGISTLTRVRNLTMNHDISVAHMPLEQLYVYGPPERRLTAPITNTTLRILALDRCVAHGYDKLSLGKLTLRTANPCAAPNTMTTITNLAIVNNNIVSDADIIGMALTSLRLEKCPLITDASISTYTALQALTLESNTAVTGICLSSLKYLRSLTCTITQVPFTSDINTAISRMCMLTSLNITFTSINDTAVQSLTNLTSLGMSQGSMVTNTGLRALTNLTELFIPKNHHVTDYGVSHLIKLTCIQAYKSIHITPACVTKIYKYRQIYTGSRGAEITTNIGQYEESDDDA